jgi:intein/homing endonuclease
LFIGQNLASYKFNELPDNSSVDFAETWVSDTLTGGEVVETTIGAIKARDVATTVMFNGSKQRRFSLEHLMLVRRDGVYAFIQAGVIKMGDYLVYDINDQATDVLVEVVGYVDEVTDVYDITVSPYSLFIAGDLISHNKKGAFQGLTQRDSE